MSINTILYQKKNKKINQWVIIINRNSVIINPNGKIKSIIDLEETGSISTNEIIHKDTLFAKFGNKMYFGLIFIYILLIFSIRKFDHE